MLTEQIRAIEQERILIPYADPFDDTFKRIQYVRYADDFLVGVIGSKEDAREIKERIRTFLADTLKLELFDEKTLITHSAKRAHFLGYNIYVRRSKATKRNCKGHLRRNLSGTVCLELPSEVMRKKLLEYRAMEIKTTVIERVTKNVKSCHA